MPLPPMHPSSLPVPATHPPRSSVVVAMPPAVDSSTSSSSFVPVFEVPAP